MAYEESNTLSDLKELYEDAKNAREQFEPDWYLNMGFYEGYQWIFWNRGSLDLPKLEDDRVMMVDNRILPSVDSRVARKTKQRPTFTATPASADEADVRSAELGEPLLAEYWDKENLDNKWYRANKWAEICGAGFIKVYWDSTKGARNVYLFGPDGKVALDANGAPLSADSLDPASVESMGLTTKTIAKGDLRYDVISPFEVFPDPLATELEECEFVIEKKIRSTGYIKERYGKDVQSDVDAPASIVSSRMIRNYAVDSGERNSVAKRGVNVYEIWHKPCEKYPDGMSAVWTDQIILKEETLSNAPYDSCPYVMVQSDPVPGRFWPTCITTQLRGPQVELNKLLSQAIENLQRIGNPTLMQSRHSNVKWGGKPGERLFFESGTPDAVPRYLEPPEMPSYLQAQLERIETSITEITGIHEVSKASVPAGVTAASAINLLQEADDTRLGPEMTLNERALSHLGQKTVRLLAKWADDIRVLAIAGEEQDYDIVEWRGNMLKDNMNISVQAGSTIARSKAAKQATMQEVFDRMLQYGVEVDPRAMRKFFKEFEVGGLDKLVATINESELQVAREHMGFRQGVINDINEYDDDDYHIAAHEEFQRSLRHERLDIKTKKLIALHVSAHRERRAQAVAMQAEQQGFTQLAPNQQGGQ